MTAAAPPGEIETARAAVPPTPTSAWFALAVLFGYQILSFMDRNVLTLLVVPIQEDLGLTDVQLGLLHGFAFALIYSLVALPAGWLVDRVSRRGIIFTGVALWSLATAACSLARSFGGLFLGRSAVGAGEATLSPAAFSLISDLFPRERLATAMGIYYTGANVGGAVALVAGGLIISAFTAAGGLDVPGVGHLKPWQATFVALGLPGVLLAVLVLFVREPHRPPPVPGEGTVAELVRLLWTRRRLFLCHYLGFPLLAIAVYAIHAWSAAYMSRRFGWDMAAIGMGLAVSTGLLGGVSNIVYGRIADRMLAAGRLDAHYRVHAPGLIAATPLLVAAFLSPGPWTFLVLLTLGLPFLTGFGGTAVSSLQLVTPPRLRGKMSALYLLALALIGSGLGPLVTAFVTEGLLQDRARVGEAVAIVVLVTGPLGGLLLALGMRPLRTELAAAP